MKGARLSPDMMSCQEIEQFCHHIPMPGNGGSTHTLRSERARMIRVADHLSFTERSTGTLCFFPFGTLLFGEDVSNAICLVSSSLI